MAHVEWLVLRTRAEIEAALARAGWTVLWFIENALNVEGRDYDVTRTASVRGGLRSWVSVLRDCEDGDFADRFEDLTRSKTARRFGTTKVYVEVRDGARACEELEHLDAAIRAGGSFEAAVATVERRGWRINSDETNEDTYDGVVWEIGASRGAEHFRLGFFHHGRDGDGIIRIDDFAQAESSSRGARVSIEIRSSALADELLDDIAGQAGVL
jgi:hypothetical protein